MAISRKEIATGLLLCLAIQPIFAASLLECAALEDVDKRLKCYDAMANRVQTKIIEVEEVRATTEVKQALRQEVVEAVIAVEPEVDQFKIVDIYRKIDTKFFESPLSLKMVAVLPRIRVQEASSGKVIESGSRGGLWVQRFWFVLMACGSRSRKFRQTRVSENRMFNNAGSSI